MSVTKSQIEEAKSRMVTVVETEGGKSESKRKPVTLRLDVPKSGKK